MTGTFFGKKALVVGGTGGIGKAVALGLAQRGAELTVHGGSSAERLEKTLDEIRKTGAKADGFLLSIDKPFDAETILKAAPGPDILVCAWGPFKRGPLEALDGEFWQSMAGGNLVFPGILVSRALPGMIKRNWGRILLFGGTNTDTIRGFFTTAAYSAAKTGLGVIAKSVAKTAVNNGMNITCNVICPGLTDTEYTDENISRYNLEKSPGGRPLTPLDIAGVCIDILENSNINGTVIPVDKGICL